MKGPHPVHEQAHVAAAIRRPGERRGKARAHRVVAENEGGKIHAPPGLSYRPEHRRVGRLAVVQGKDGIAARQGSAGNGPARLDKMTKNPGERFIPNRSPGFSRQQASMQVKKAVHDLPRRFFHELHGLTVHARNAEKPVQRKPGRGHEQEQSHPAEGRPGIALVQQRVAGAPHRRQMQERQSDEDEEMRHGFGSTRRIRPGVTSGRVTPARSAECRPASTCRR